MSFDFGLGLVIAFIAGLAVSAYYFEERIKALEEKLRAAGL